MQSPFPRSIIQPRKAHIGPLSHEDLGSCRVRFCLCMQASVEQLEPACHGAIPEARQTGAKTHCRARCGARMGPRLVMGVAGIVLGPRRVVAVFACLDDQPHLDNISGWCALMPIPRRRLMWWAISVYVQILIRRRKSPVSENCQTSSSEKAGLAYIPPATPEEAWFAEQQCCAPREELGERRPDGDAGASLRNEKQPPIRRRASFDEVSFRDIGGLGYWEALPLPVSRTQACISEMGNCYMDESFAPRSVWLFSW